MVKGKKHPTDFALWKFSPKNEKRQMEWDAPWGKGFPGWHIECSAMSMKYLGEQFEIHTGGIDHIPVHHTNEIAQAEAATGKKPFVKYWVHHNFLRVDGEKMSKSLGNFYTLDDVVKKGFSPMALRLMFLQAHYRDELNFTWESLQAFQSGWERLLGLVERFHTESGRTELSEEKLTKVEEYRTRFFAAIENDLATPEAMATMWEMLKSNIPSGDKFELLREFDEVLGLELEKHASEFAAGKKAESEKLPKEVEDLIAERLIAKNTKDYVKADKLRKQITDLGWQIDDGADGTFSWQKKKS
jgi:cysteinyl-tRNA synthetase